MAVRRPQNVTTALKDTGLSTAATAVSDPYREGNPALRVMGPVRPVSSWPALSGNVYTIDSRLYDLFEEMLHKDGKIYAAIDQRIDGVTTCRRQLEPASPNDRDQEIHAFVEYAIGGIDFDKLIETCLQALPYGIAIIEILWTAQNGRIVPSGFRHIHPSRVVFDTAGNMFLAGSGHSGDPLPPERFIVVRYGSQFDNPYGDGLLSHVMYLFWFKKNVTTFWLRASERIGQPALIGKYPAGDSGARDQIIGILSDLSGNGYAAIPDAWVIETVKAATEAGAFGEGLHGLADWLDDQIAMTIVGVTLTSGEGRRSGSLALGTVHNDTRLEKVQGDARLITSAIREQLIGPLVRWNFGEDAPLPFFSIDTGQPEDLNAKADMVKKLVSLGLPITAEYLYDSFDVPYPGEGERTLRFDDTNLYQYHLQFGVLTINEVRATLGLPPVPWGDKAGALSASAPGSAPGQSVEDPPASFDPSEHIEPGFYDDRGLGFDEGGGLLRRLCAAFGKKKSLTAPEIVAARGAYLLNKAIGGRRDAFTRSVRKAARGGEGEFYRSVQIAAAATPWLDPRPLSDLIVIAWAFGLSESIPGVSPSGRPSGETYPKLPAGSRAGSGAAQAPESASAFRDTTPPWLAAAERFLGKELVTGPEMERELKRIDAAHKAGLLPDLSAAREAAYSTAVTMVRESDRAILSHVDQLLARAIEGKVSPGDFVQDLDDLYRSLGLDEQQGWYARLVVNNATGRAWQEGRDYLSHDWDEATKTWKPADWVWGYQWDHQDSGRPRPSHAAMDGHVAPKDDPVWRTFGPPPIAHNCHCIRWTLSLDDAIEKGLVDSNGNALPGVSFQAPTVTATQLRAAGADKEKIRSLAGKPVTEVMRAMPGDHFPRSHYDVANRTMLNPSLLKPLDNEARGILRRYPDAVKLINSPFTPLPEGQARVLSSPAEASIYARERYTRWSRSLTPQELDAVRRYKADDTDKTYSVVNTYLRFQAKGMATGQINTALAEGLIPSLDAALAKSPLPEPLTVYRTFQRDEIADLVDAGHAVGYVDRDAGFMSTALTRKGIESHVKSGNIVARFYVPSGVQAAAVDLPGIRNKGEYELLISRGKQYRINKAWKENDVYMIEAEILT